MITTDLSPLRLNALRLLYGINFLFVGFNALSSLVTPENPVAQLPGVAFSFWAALGLLSALGLRYPVKMLPVLFMQLCYKTVWLVTIALPIWTSGQWDSSAPSLFGAMIGGALADLLVIPWAYVYANFVRAPGDPWKLALTVSRPPGSRPEPYQ